MVENRIFNDWLKDEKNMLSVFRVFHTPGKWALRDAEFVRAEGLHVPFGFLQAEVARSLAQVLPLMTKSERLLIAYPTYISYYEGERGPEERRACIEELRAKCPSGNIAYYACDTGFGEFFDRTYHEIYVDRLTHRLFHWLGLFGGESPLEEVFFVSVAGLFPAYPQIQIGPYRVDYFTPGKTPIVWEIDGKKYHKSREQKRKDKERDEYMKARGFHVVRVRWADLQKGYTATALEIYERLNK